MPEGSYIDARYELLESLGRGGEAEVFRARDTRGGGEVAVRLARSGHDFSEADVPALPAQFHPAWTRLLNTGRDPRRGPYQVFELLVGETFRQIAERGPLDPGSWRAFAEESLDAVGALHAAGWAHGDLNADNFLRLIAPPRAWQLLELPFLRAAGRPGSAALFGGIHTLAPEQFDGVVPTAASDIFALGCLYYYGASGEFPHGGGGGRDIAIGRVRFAPEPLREKAPAFPVALADWVMPLLERDPQKRPAAAVAARHLLALK